MSNPLALHFKLNSMMSPNIDAEQEYMSNVSFANVVSSLMYVMVCMGLDISHVVGVGGSYMHNPRKGHWQAVKWILRCILKLWILV